MGWDPVWDNVLLGVVVAFLAAAVLVLATGHVSALVFDGGWPRYPAADIPGVLWRVVTDPGDPGRAWDPLNRGAAPPGPVAWWGTPGDADRSEIRSGNRARLEGLVAKFARNPPM